MAYAIDGYQIIKLRNKIKFVARMEQSLDLLSDYKDLVATFITKYIISSRMCIYIYVYTNNTDVALVQWGNRLPCLEIDQTECINFSLDLC